MSRELLKLIFYSEDHEDKEDVLRKIVEVYEYYKENICDSIEFQAIEEFYLLFMAFKCYKWNIKDSNLVTNVLRKVYRSTDHCMLIFQRADWKEQALECFRYFINHANSCRFLWQGHRLVDCTFTYTNDVSHSCQYAVKYTNPKLLLLLLRHGALLGDYEEYEIYKLDILKDFLKIILKWMESTAVLTIQNINEFEPFQDLLSCLRILMRALPPISLKELTKNFCVTNDHHINIVICKFLIEELSDLGLIKYLTQRVLRPSELQHLCRCRVRKILYDNWNLPLGIRTLPVPIRIQNYIDLMYD
ncbi:uncharacterized protein [Centruroides vittatus]|uniref:uncharacterized protein n=1 Tax=Centruroides vittatus TaxID=120091 RepID=UPI0035109F96